jgi:2-haloacid dehalogenase
VELPRISAVVFDLGGVLIDWDPRYLYRTLFDDEAAMEEFLATITTPEWNRAQDAGRPWAEAVEELAEQHPDRRDLIEAYWRRWPETLGDAIAPTVAVLDELRTTGVRLYALSNWSGETFPAARPRYPFLGWFDGIVISGDERLIKPDARIFRVLLDRYGLTADEVVFIDDHQANVDAAAELGMHAARFVDPATLRSDLRRFGLPVAEHSGQATPD